MERDVPSGKGRQQGLGAEKGGKLQKVTLNQLGQERMREPASLEKKREGGDIEQDFYNEQGA